MAKSVPDCTTLFIPTALKSFNIVWLVNLCLYHVTLNVYCWFVSIKTNIFKSKHIFKTTWRKLTEISPTHNPETIAREISGRNAWKNGKRKFTNCFWKKMENSEKKSWKFSGRSPWKNPGRKPRRISLWVSGSKKDKKNPKPLPKEFQGKIISCI